MRVELVDSTNGTMIEALSMCRDKQCTEQTIDHCLKAKPVPHLAVLEFSDFTFRVEGLSVKARIQLERHRLFSSMERSTRHINMSEAEFIVPPTAKNKGLFEKYLGGCRWFYNSLIENGESEEDAAYILPLAVETRFYLKGNGRVFFEYFTKRLCKKHVQPEHYLFARELYRQLVKQIPQFKYANPCRGCGQCSDAQKHTLEPSK